MCDKSVQEIEAEGDALVLALKKVNAAYARINYSLMALEIRIKEDADKNRRVGLALGREVSK